MNETKWERYGAGAGVAFVILFLASVFVAPLPPHIDASTARVTSYVTEHRHALLTSMLLSAFATLAFLWFLGHLRHVLQRAEGGAEAISPIVLTSGIALAATGLLMMLPMGTLAFMAGHGTDAAGASVVRMLFDMSYVLGGITGLAAGLFVIATSLAMVRREMLQPNLGWLGMLFAALLWISGAAGFYVTSYNRTIDVVAYIGFFGFALWMLLASVAMYQRPEVERARPHHAIFA